jgi:hypothetical protein
MPLRGELRRRAAELGVRIENVNEEQRKRRIAAEARNSIVDELNDMDLPPPIRQTLLLLKGLDERFDTIDRLREELTAFHTGYSNILNDITGLVRQHDEGQYEETYRNLLKDMADLVQHRDDKRVEEMQDIEKDIATIVHKESGPLWLSPCPLPGSCARYLEMRTSKEHPKACISVAHPWMVSRTSRTWTIAVCLPSQACSAQPKGFHFNAKVLMEPSSMYQALLDLSLLHLLQLGLPMLDIPLKSGVVVSFMARNDGRVVVILVLECFVFAHL